MATSPMPAPSVIHPRNPLPGVVYPAPDRLQQYVSSGLIEARSLGEALWQASAKWPDRVALRSAETGRSYSFREMDELSDRFGAALLALGLQPRDRVIFQIGNVEELFFGLYGCFKAGLIAIATLPNHREQEIGFIADFTQARAHIVQANFRRADLPAFAQTMAREHPSLEHIITVGGQADIGHSFDELVVGQEAEHARAVLQALDVGPLDVAMFQLSGGTTGIPKIIPRFHGEYRYNMEAWADMSAYDETSVVYWPMPIIHNAGIVCGTVPAHLRGGAVIVQQSLEPEAMLRTISEGKVTTTVAPIPLLVRMIDSGLIKNFDLSSVRDFITAGQTPLVERELGVPGYHLFGMSEGLCMRTRASDPADARARTVGRPLSELDEVKLLQPGSDEEVPEGEVGELCCRGPYTIAGYYNAPDHNKKAFTADGFYRSGDLMRAHRIDGQVYYSFEGRIKDNIDRGAEKISAEEIERVIIDHPDVREVAVIGMPDREFGERVCAYIIPEKQGVAPDVETLRDFLVGRGLAKFKCPERIEIVDTFPVTKVGKVSKPDLRRDIETKLSSCA